jgi:hypothetical protein
VRNGTRAERDFPSSRAHLHCFDTCSFSCRPPHLILLTSPRPLSFLPHTFAGLSLRQTSPRPINLFTFELFRRPFCIYPWPYTSPNEIQQASVLHLICTLQNNIRLDFSCFRYHESPSYSPEISAALGSIPSTRHSSSAAMSFNITSDGSPTPRKGSTRFSGDLRIDTSPEVLGQAVGSMSLNQYPFALRRTFGSSLTTNTQGMKRPIGSSALGSQPVLQQYNSFDGYKVSTLPILMPAHLHHSA